MDTGQPISFSPTSASMRPLISQGALTVAHAVPGGWYANLDAGSGNTLSRLGIKFRFDGGDTSGLVVNISLTNGPSLNAGGDLYRIGVHLVVSDTSWAATKVSNETGTLDFKNLRNGKLKLSQGSEHTVELWRNGDTAIVALPDGQVVDITDPDIAAWSGQYGFFEEAASTATDALPGITQAWYDQAPDA